MNSTPISFPVVKVVQPLGEFFIGNIPAKDLVQISYADVRRIEKRDVEKYLGIQRPLDKSRVGKIKQYLHAPDAAFPTGVVLAVDQNCAEYDQAAGKLTLKKYDADFLEDSIPHDKIAKVLDGQHRIAAFMDDSGNYDFTLGELSNFQFNVVVFVGLDIDEQANIFATVNLAQTKVNKSLVYDLEGLSKTRSPFRTCHQIAVALDSADSRSPLYHRIKRLGVKTIGRENSAEPLTQAAFVESLIKLISPNAFDDRTTFMKGKVPKKVEGNDKKRFPFRNMFIEEKDNDIALILFNYFTSIKTKWPLAWEGTNQEGNILPRSNAFKALMRYLRIAYIQVVGDQIGRVPSAEEFNSAFSEIQAMDNDFTSGNFKPGSGGEALFYKLLIGETTIQDLKNS